MSTRRTTTLLLAAAIVAVALPIAFRQASAVAELRRERETLRTPPPPAVVADPETTAETAAGVTLQAEATRLEQAITETGADARAATTRWGNTGGATPVTALGTLLWAAAGGDVGEVERRIAFDTKAATAAERFLAGLPPALRAEFSDTRRLVATMLAARLPLDISGADVVAETSVDADTTLVRLRVQRSGTKAREMELRFHRDAAGWQLLVPAPIIDGYRYLLTGS